MSTNIRLYIKRNHIKKIEVFFLYDFYVFYYNFDNSSLKWSNKWLIKSSNFL